MDITRPLERTLLLLNRPDSSCYVKLLVPLSKLSTESVGGCRHRLAVMRAPRLRPCSAEHAAVTPEQALLPSSDAPKSSDSTVGSVPAAVGTLRVEIAIDVRQACINAGLQSVERQREVHRFELSGHRLLERSTPSHRSHWKRARRSAGSRPRGDLSDLNTYDSAKSVADPHRIVDATIAKGDRPAVGFMAVPVTWAARFGRTTDDLFDGCINISIATAMVSEFEHACTLRPDHRRPQKHPSRRRRRELSSPSLRYCILRRLEIDLNITGVPENVLPEAAKLDAAPADPDVDPPAARSSPLPRQH
jgi:hypothetical protein